MKSKKIASMIIATLAAGSLSGLAEAALTIIRVGPIPGRTDTFPSGLSADGSTVVGEAFAGIGHAFRWTAATGAQDIGAGEATAQSSAIGVNADGSVVVGSVGSSSPRAFRWTAAGVQDLGYLPGGNLAIASAVSGNGSVIVGSATDSSLFRSFRWTAATGLQALPTAPGFDYSLGAYGISADGTVIVGTNGNSAAGSNADRAYRYTTGVYQNLGVRPGFSRSVALGVSGDGKTVIGFSQLANAGATGAFRWTASTGLTPLFFDDESSSVAEAVSFDGSRIVGLSTNASGSRAVMGTSTLGSVDLNTYFSTIG